MGRGATTGPVLDGTVEAAARGGRRPGFTGSFVLAVALGTALGTTGTTGTTGTATPTSALAGADADAMGALASWGSALVTTRS